MCQCRGISGLFDVPEGATGYGDPNYVDWNTANGGGYYPYGGASTSPANSNNWWTALTAGIKGATGILGARYAVPQLNPGQLIQTGPNGQSLMYQGTAGNMSSFPSLSNMSLGSGGSMLPLLAVGAVVLFMMKK